MLATLKVSFSVIVDSDVHCQIPDKSWIWPNISKCLLAVKKLFQVAMVTVVDDIICYNAHCMSASVVIIKPPIYSSCSIFGTSHKFCPHCRSVHVEVEAHERLCVHGLLQAFMGSWWILHALTLSGGGEMYKSIYTLLY